MMTEPNADVQVVGGVDTHAEVHLAAVIDQVGRELGHAAFPTIPMCAITCPTPPSPAGMPFLGLALHHRGTGL